MARGLLARGRETASSFFYATQLVARITAVCATTPAIAVLLQGNKNPGFTSPSPVNIVRGRRDRRIVSSIRNHRESATTTRRERNTKRGRRTSSPRKVRLKSSQERVRKLLPVREQRRRRGRSEKMISVWGKLSTATRDIVNVLKSSREESSFHSRPGRLSTRPSTRSPRSGKIILRRGKLATVFPA